MTRVATFRDMTADDVPDGLALCRESGWNQTEADWRMLLEPPSVFRGAVAGGRVIGSAGAMVYGEALAWVCMVLVSPPFRGRGIATRLVEQVLERLPEVRAVGLDATPDGQSVYARLGFQPKARLARYLAVAAPRGEAAPSLARPLREAELHDAAARDASAIGAPRERALRHAFATAPEYAWGLGEGEALRALSFGRHGTSAEHIGPIVAESVSDAAVLVRACLGRTPGQRFFLDAPERSEWTDALFGLGFREQRPFARMFRGGLPPAGHPETIYAAFGPELG